MGRRSKLADMHGEFRKRYTVDQKTGCWVWKLNVVRYRVDLGYSSVVINPRRYAAYLEGFKIEVTRQVINGCSNPLCISPWHTVLKHNRQPISQCMDFYLTFEDLERGSAASRIYYGKTMDEMRAARAATLLLIKQIKYEPVRYNVDQIAHKYNLPYQYAKRCREMTIQEYMRLKEDVHDNGETPLDEMGDGLLPDAHLFS